MAAGGFTKSLLAAPNKAFELQCEVCHKKGNKTEAKHFCESCNLHICDSCKTIHDRIPDLREHKMYPSMKQHDCGLCLKQGNKIKANHLCKTCKSYICLVCMDAHGSFDALKHHIIISIRRCALSANLKLNEQQESQKSTLKSSKPVENVDRARSATTRPSVGLSVERQTKPLADMTVRTSGMLNIKLENDEETPCITGCCFMPGGELVLCDFSNRKIKLLSRYLKLQDCLALQGPPWDVADLDGNNIAVTLPDNQQIQLIQVLPTVKKVRTVSVSIKCYSIAVAGGLTHVYGIVDSVPGKVMVFDINWNLKGKFRVSGLVEKFKAKLGIDPKFCGVGYIAFSQAASRVFVSYFDTNTVTCLSSDNKVLWRYKDDTEAVPRGLYVDSHDNIIVCNSRNHCASIDILTSKGERYKPPTLLSSRDGIDRPQCVTFRPYDQTLVVGCDDSNVVYVYTLS